MRGLPLSKEHILSGLPTKRDGRGGAGNQAWGGRDAGKQALLGSCSLLTAQSWRHPSTPRPGGLPDKMQGIQLNVNSG